jgi:hypothetical protein
MIDFRGIASSDLRKEPYEWARIDRAIPEERVRELIESFPDDEFWELAPRDRERQWSYSARPLVPLGADAPDEALEWTAPWRELVDDLLSPAYRESLSELIGKPLDDALMEASVWRWEPDAHLSPQTDLAEKIVTQVFYLSYGWDPSWGGCLEILRSPNSRDVFEELPPLPGLASVLVRSDRSWHAVSPARDSAPEPRRNVVVTWHRPGSESVVWDTDGGGMTRCRSSRRRASRPAGRPARTRPVRVAMVGTFDIANFGDLLLPIVAEHELQMRLGPVELTAYGYRSLPAGSWPYAVRSLGRLPEDVSEYDLLLVGGGQVVRSDPDFEATYEPDDPGVHHPLGLWLTPTLVAAAAGVPVVWNAPGVAPGIAGWVKPLAATAAASAARVAVRDRFSAQRLAELAPAQRIEVVPDTAFGIGALMPERESPELIRLREEMGLDGRYVVIHTSPRLADHRSWLLELIAAARRHDFAVVELPLSPAHGERPGLLDLPPPVLSTDRWPEPTVLAELLWRAEAVAASSFHAGVVAVAAGVPLSHPEAEPTSKHEVLDGLPGVTALPKNGATPPAPSLGRHEAARMPELRAALAGHWDATAAAVADEGVRRPSAQALRALAELPLRIEAAHAPLRTADEHIASMSSDLAWLRAREEELEQQLAETRHELAETRRESQVHAALRGRKSVRAALAVADRVSPLLRRR